MFDSSLDAVLMDESMSMMPTVVETPAPTLSPTEMPVQTPSEVCNSLPRDEALEEQLSTITDPSLLRDTSTPQGQAFQWLLSEDPAQVNPCEYPSLDQRYGLATLYYSTSAQADWTTSTGWLSGTDECTWFNVACGNGMVTGLDLGKYICCFVCIAK